MVKVSVIVPVYNMEKYLEKCLDSLLSQTLAEIEIITVDDGSSDSSPDILERYAKKASNVIYVRKENNGLSDARNLGLTYAQGEYVGYVDSDDFADPEMFEVMYAKAIESGSDIVECNLHHTYPSGEDTEIMVKYYKPCKLLCFGRFIVWNKIYRRSWLLDTGVSFPLGLIYEDVSFISKLIPFITKYDYVDIAPIHYVQRRGSLNHMSSEKTLQILNILRGIYDFYSENGFCQQYECELEYMFTRILLCSSFSRMCNIRSNTLRKEALELNLRELSETFPDWRKNLILAGDRSRQGLFMRSVNKATYKIYSKLLPLFFTIMRRFSMKSYYS